MSAFQAQTQYQSQCSCMAWHRKRDFQTERLPCRHLWRGSIMHNLNIPISIWLVHFAVIYYFELLLLLRSSDYWLRPVIPGRGDCNASTGHSAPSRWKRLRDDRVGLHGATLETLHVVAAAFECMKSMLKMNGVAQPCCSVRSCKETEPARKSVIYVQPFSDMWKFCGFGILLITLSRSQRRQIG